MEEDRFWDLVAQLRLGGGDDSRAGGDDGVGSRDDVARLRRAFTALLAGLTDGDFGGFTDRWYALRDRADGRPLVEAVTVEFGHCGDDMYSNLRDWLICQGREAYERILAEPDSLVDVLGPGGLDDAEPVASALWDALRQRPRAKGRRAYPPPGPIVRGVDDPAELRARYPRCAAARDAYLASSLPAVAVPLDLDRRTRTLSLGATWAPRPRRTD